MTELPLELVGAYGSPCSRKMRAALRYRRIPHGWIVRGCREDRGIPEVPVALIPVLVFAGRKGAPDTAMIDSSFQIRRLSRQPQLVFCFHRQPSEQVLSSSSSSSTI